MARISNKNFTAILFSFLFIAKLGAFDKTEHIDGLGDPSSYVASCVNVTTGAFVYSSPDLIVDCPEEISFVRHYNSFNTLEETFGTGFTHNHATGEVRFSYDNKTKVKTVYVDDRGGNCLKYSRKSPILKFGSYPLDSSHIDSGLTNTYAGVISGRTNLRNSYVVATDKPSVLKRMRLGDGTEREYNSHNQLIKEIRPSGNIISYKYLNKKQNTLQRIAAYNSDYSKLLGWVSFSYDSKGRLSKIKSSDQKWASYYCEGKTMCKIPLHRQPFLITSKAYNQPKNSYNYLHETIKLYPEGADSFIKVNIRRLGSIDVLGKSKVKCSYDKEGRVQTLYLPGSKGLNSSYSFSYNTSGSITKVFNPIGGVEEYSHSSNRINAKKTYMKNSSSKMKLYRAESFFWGRNEGKGDFRGNLMIKAISDGKHKYQAATEFTYDGWRNVTKKTLFGNLSGHVENPVTIPLFSIHSLKVSGKEQYSDYYRYSTDGRNLLLSHTTEEGVEEVYEYVPETNRVSAKITKSNNQVIKREFFEYNSFMALTKKWEDNGSSTDKNAFDDVTHSTVVVHTLNEESNTSGFGKPLETIEGYIDPETGSIVQLKRKSYVYGKFHQLEEESVFDANDQHQYTLFYEYDDLGRCIREVDREGIATNYQYDQYNLCIFAQREGSGFATHFKYDYADRLIEKKEVHESGEEFTYAYAYDKMGNLLKETDAYGHVKKMTYDTLGRLIETEYPQVQLADGTIEHPIEKKEYDIFDRVVKEVDPEGNVTSKKYTTRGQVSEVVYPDESKETYIYNLNGTLGQKIEKNGAYHLMEYDDILRLVKEETYSAEEDLLKSKEYGYQSDLLAYEVDATGVMTEFQYDFAGRMISKAVHGDENAQLETYVYDSMGRLCETRKWLSVEEGTYISNIQVFDVVDRVIEEQTVDSEGLLISYHTYTYDSNGNRIEEVVWQSEDTFSVSSSEYTSYGMLLSCMDPMGNTTTYTYDFQHENALGQVVLQTTVVDPMGRSTITTKDALGRDETVRKEDSEGKLLASEKMCYDLVGNRIAHHTDVIAYGNKLRTYTVLWEYDSMNRVVHLWEDPEGKSKKTAYTYHPMGMLASKHKPDGVTIHHKYDSLGREMEVSTTDNTVHYTYTYNDRDQLIVSHDLIGNLTLERDHDAFGNLVWEKLPTGLAFQYAYDALNRLINVGLPDGSHIHYRYKSSGMFAVERYSSAGDILYSHEYLDLDLQGRSLKSQTITNDLVYFDWDLNGRLKSIDSSHFKQTIPEDGYDRVGNLLKADFINGDKRYQNAYAYDALNQLVSESTQFEKSYSYDSVHNRVKEDDQEYQINSLNQIEETEKSRYTYDLNGNLVHQLLDTTYIKYQYDGLNRLTSLEKEDDWKTEYIYDSYGRRIISKHYVWNSNWVLQEGFDFLYQGIYEVGCCDIEGNFRQLRVMGKREGPALRACVAFEIEGKPYAPLYDHIFNVVALVDLHSEKQVGAYRYSAFGIMEDLQGGSAQSPWLFSNQRYDELGDLYHFGVRDYRPEIGRWISPDPGDFVDGMNLYAYTRNCPTMHLDFYGYATRSPERKPIACPVYGGLVCGEAADPVLKGVGKYVETLAHHMLPYSPQRFFLEGCGRMIQGESFVPEEGFMLQSVSGVVEGHEISGIRVRYIPGILTTKDACKAQAENISKKYFNGAEVYWTCQQSRGFVQDLVQCVAEMMHIETPAIQHLSEQIMSDYHEMEAVYGDEFKLATIAHSRGGLDFHEGTKDLPREARDRMDILALGSAKVLDKRMYGELDHYSNIYDIVNHFALMTCSDWENANFKFTNFSSGSPVSFILDHFIDCDGYQDLMDAKSTIWQGL